MKSNFLRRINRQYRRVTSRRRMLPDFLIAGAQKGGTTSLYTYLVQHPSVLQAEKKEIHFFNNLHDVKKDLNWYRSHFPIEKDWSVQGGEKRITGEATPFMYSYHTPRFVHDMLPDVKLIFLLRHPVYRAFSHYQHNKRHSGRENLSFSEAIRAEDERISNDIMRSIKDQRFNDELNRTYSYVHRGFYSEQLTRWLHYFKRDQMYITKSEEFYAEPERVLSEIVSFLGITPYRFDITNVSNKGGYTEKISKEDTDYLNEKYATEFQKLKELTGIEFGKVPSLVI